MDEFKKSIDCGQHKMDNLKFDCETVDGKTLPRWSISCKNCGAKEYSNVLNVEYVPVPIVVFSDKTYRI